jgi:hypothetical protein
MKPREWLLLLFEVSASRSNLRVRVWRRLQAIGAVNLKGSVYALPKTPETEEDLDWIRRTLVDGGGEASLMTATHTRAEDDALIRKFREAREREYLELGEEIASLRRRLDRAGNALSEERLHALRSSFRNLAQAHAAIRKRDYFPSKAAKETRDRLDALKGALERGTGGAPSAPSAPRGLRVRDFRGRKWVTRAGMHADRLASAWLIRTFIDPKARFGFARARNAQAIPPPALPFDMDGALFGHHGEDCTYETLIKAFALGKDPGVAALGEIIHDVDLKDGKYGRPEAPGIDAFVRGLREDTGSDAELLAAGIRFFDALYKALR